MDEQHKDIGVPIPSPTNHSGDPRWRWYDGQLLDSHHTAVAWLREGVLHVGDHRLLVQWYSGGWRLCMRATTATGQVLTIRPVWWRPHTYIAHCHPQRYVIRHVSRQQQVVVRGEVGEIFALDVADDATCLISLGVGAEVTADPHFVLLVVCAATLVGAHTSSTPCTPVVGDEA
ncbi:hypothetical protein ACFPVT_07980 [Corynebacterium choanae]|uniref:Uncharacterized protein n=1 Tax=Corynebacterium choanae TaxID=1862358 RepID=A0A3G6J7F4_9CORY|nr:hypothetical protein [Corynebacterium choanae]AZA14051.1 hypothetical protein CCHOA_08310 [Corynebacterium choanae]